MQPSANQILTVAQMRDAEEALIARGTSVDALMQIAGQGAADWVWRLSAHRAVTVLCGPGNNGGDGYVIAEALRARGCKVRVIAAVDPQTPAARNARALFRGEVLDVSADPHGEVLVDCLFGSGLTRPLSPEHAGLLARLASYHRHSIAVDLPSGVDSDHGMTLNDGLPTYDLTIALGAWKFAHVLMPASSRMGELRLVDIGVLESGSAARMLVRPLLQPPEKDDHKYRRGLLGVIAGAMPGAAVLAGIAAQGAGAGYVRILGSSTVRAPAHLVVDHAPLPEALADERIGALLCGPGLGRDAGARERMVEAIASEIPLVLDADALVLLAERHLAERDRAIIATPHEGELFALERAFACDGSGSKVERARALAQASGMVIVAKGPDTVIAAADGRTVCNQRTTSWLSTSGTGDVLAGAIASRLACGSEAFLAACEGLWLHGEAARRCAAPFHAGQLADAIPLACAAALSQKA